jgi:hypothetical protein
MLQVFSFPPGGFANEFAGSGNSKFNNLNISGSQSTDEHQLLFSTNLGESVRAVECGMVTRAGFQEIVVCGYSGSVSNCYYCCSYCCCYC